MTNITIIPDLSSQIMLYTPEEDKRLTDLWHKAGFKYIVDPVPNCQALPIQYRDIPEKYKKMVDVQFIYISPEQYRSGKWDFNRRKYHF